MEYSGPCDVKVDSISQLLTHWLAPEKFEWNFRHVIFKQILVIDVWGICCEIALIWMSLDFTDDQSTLVQVMACCHQATSHYLSRCCPDLCRPQASLGHNELNLQVVAMAVVVTVPRAVVVTVPRAVVGVALAVVKEEVVLLVSYRPHCWIKWLLTRAGGSTFLLKVRKL